MRTNCRIDKDTHTQNTQRLLKCRRLSKLEYKSRKEPDKNEAMNLQTFQTQK